MKKCIVFGCKNCKGEGTFVGDMCAPCHKLIVQGLEGIGPGTTFIHVLREQHILLLDIVRNVLSQIQRWVRQ